MNTTSETITNSQASSILRTVAVWLSCLDKDRVSDLGYFDQWCDFFPLPCCCLWMPNCCKLNAQQEDFVVFFWTPCSCSVSLLTRAVAGDFWKSRSVPANWFSVYVWKGVEGKKTIEHKRQRTGSRFGSAASFFVHQVGLSLSSFHSYFCGHCSASHHPSPPIKSFYSIDLYSVWWMPVLPLVCQQNSK